MLEILDIVNAFPEPLKAAWVAWLAWGAGQIVWYRRGRVPVVKALPAPRPRPRRPPKPVAPPVGEPIPIETAAPEPRPVEG
jgi:hypothetical protein